jgi:hypothetical protein
VYAPETSDSLCNTTRRRISQDNINFNRYFLLRGCMKCILPKRPILSVILRGAVSHKIIILIVIENCIDQVVEGNGVRLVWTHILFA